MTTIPVISVRGLHHAYGSGALERKVLHGLNVDFHPGEITIVMGHSGSGKSTFLTLVGALRTVQTGQVRVLDQELGGATASQLVRVRRSIGFIFQRHNLLAALTARQNVHLALALHHPAAVAADADRLLARVGLGAHGHKRPRELSGGQQQRVAIARALAGHPRVLIADEPTASLDRQSGRDVVELMRALARDEQCAVLMATHDPRILDIADRILTLEDGVMTETDAALQRLADELAELVGVLTQYPACFPAERTAPTAELPPLRERFSAGATTLAVQTADYVHLRLRPGLADKAGATQQLAATVQTLEQTLVDFLATLRASPADLQSGLGDRLFQAMEVLLFATLDAARSRSRADTDMLGELTRDRGHAMRRLRQTYLTAGETGSEERRAAVFQLTQGFERLVFLLSEMARFVALAPQDSPQP
ncbi:ATP-binding cassette domain-containing protein [Opitutus sp. ER46]|uniref:ATP-binding cassette domain-containing protein n=1 Tax=Opitutus sp. ER46 TaxID=2161864 RepID=UPI000D2FF270|nr:ATP-binding cassette domain-containing protein [Opitutus sp. ER46]PTX91751.1 hypothetical protein DB354_17985 [Opitutus sp. ER46]